MSAVSDFIKAAAALGFTENTKARNGHRVFRNASGEAVRVSATPSDRRWASQAIRDMERAAGRRLPRPNSGRYRHRPPTSTPRGDRAPKRNGCPVVELVAAAEVLHAAFLELTAAANPADIAEAHSTRQAFDCIRDRLADRRVVIEPLT